MLQDIIDTLIYHQAENIKVLDVHTLTPFTDTFVICTAHSNRHAQTLSEETVKQSKAQGQKPLGVEGVKVGEWILIDLDNVIVHIMLPASRALYQLEKLWDSQALLKQEIHA